MSLRVLVTGFLIMLLAALDVSAETARIQTKENALREQCRFLSPVKVRVQYGDVITIIAKEGDWYRSTFRGAEGCIHRGAVEERAFGISGLSGKEKRSASEAEVALAGKGFNPEVERSYRSKHPDMNFSAVDRIERYALPEPELAEFIKRGGLNEP